LQDDKEQTSVEAAEGGENDEYLQPKCRTGIVSPSPQPESPIPQNQTNWDREMHKYPQPRRYCSDPVAHKGIDIDLFYLQTILQFRLLTSNSRIIYNSLIINFIFLKSTLYTKLWELMIVVPTYLD
jgi:hypothetical protein